MTRPMCQRTFSRNLLNCRRIALSYEWQRRLSKAGVLLGKDLAKFRQAFEGIGAAPMAIGPFVIAKDIDEGMLERLEQPMPLGEERIRAWA